jgi:hypothetical protein
MASRVASAWVHIDAPLHVVWAALVDFVAYPEWNPFIVRVDGPEVLETTADALVLHVVLPDGRAREVPVQVTDAVEPHPDALGHVAWLAWSFTDWPARWGLLGSNRMQRLVQGLGRETVYHTEEAFEGLLAPFVPLEQVQAGFEAQAEALKAYCESLVTRGGTLRGPQG